jgi:hypothetical protein
MLVATAAEARLTVCSTGMIFRYRTGQPDQISDANDVHVTASAIAAFEATQAALLALVTKGVLSKAEAEAILRKAIEVIRTEGTGDQAAELLTGILERSSR